MAGSEISDELAKWLVTHQAVLRIKGDRGKPGKVMASDALHVTVVDLRGATQYRGQWNVRGDVFVLAGDGLPVATELSDINALSSDRLRSAQYTRFTGNQSNLKPLSERLTQNSRSATYPGGSVEILGKKEVQEMAPELAEEQIMSATQAEAAPIDVIVTKPLDIPKLELHKIARDLISSISVAEPAEVQVADNIETILKLGDFAQEPGRKMRYYLNVQSKLPEADLIWRRIGDVAAQHRGHAADWLSEIRHIAPFSPQTYLYKAAVAKRAGLPGFEFEFTYEALRRRPSLPVWTNLQDALLGIDANTRLQKLCLLEEIEKESPDMWKNRSRLARGLGIRGKAIEYNVQAFRRNPQDGATLAELKDQLKNMS
ncbi:MAG: hypothetical protein HYT16_01210 [DPANN group archaeon]|nr:hypothetical protein [DPANN group archaeon]